jgi:hypothetical protein
MTFTEKNIRTAVFKSAFGIINMFVKTNVSIDTVEGRFFVSTVEDTAYLSVNKINSESIACGMYETCLVYFDEERSSANYDNQIRLTHSEYLDFIKFFVAYAQSQSMMEAWDKSYEAVFGK